jgi:hypothetical protein
VPALTIHDVLYAVLPCVLPHVAEIIRATGEAISKVIAACRGK